MFVLKKNVHDNVSLDVVNPATPNEVITLSQVTVLPAEDEY